MAKSRYISAYSIKCHTTKFYGKQHIYSCTIVDIVDVIYLPFYSSEADDDYMKFLIVG
jgi:hypothetical protein